MREVSFHTPAFPSSQLPVLSRACIQELSFCLVLSEVSGRFFLWLEDICHLRTDLALRQGWGTSGA